MKTLVRATICGSALVLGITVGCFGDLPRGRSCGDGWWDPEYEECDESSGDRSYVDECRKQGWDKNAECDPNTCEIRASELECEQCGDGKASGTEVCDGNDVRGATCPSGSGVVRCTDKCELDFELCPEVCGDGVVNGTEECEPSLSCGSDEDCGPGRVCYMLLGECVPSDGFGPNLSCGYYNTFAIGMEQKIEKPYASGTISRCTDECVFGRNNCGFCGDGELDGSYSDLAYPGGDLVPFPGEFCDGSEAAQTDIEAYCEPLCVDEAINADVVVLCEFECNANCSDFAPPDDIVPSPESLGCCLAAKSPCPLSMPEGVPDLPCCAWLEHPDWPQDCVVKDTDDLPISYVCPG
ncbi:MAG TPA: hypothetical protein VM869_31980 [Enhygromyxa sp.]|nr:hypothetical protein [Enhygromyxa sp.]